MTIAFSFNVKQSINILYVLLLCNRSWRSIIGVFCAMLTKIAMARSQPSSTLVLLQSTVSGLWENIRLTSTAIMIVNFTSFEVSCARSHHARFNNLWARAAAGSQEPSGRRQKILNRSVLRIYKMQLSLQVYNYRRKSSWRASGSMQQRPCFVA